MKDREKLADKTAKIEGIKNTLKQSVGLTDFDKVLAQVQVEERDDILSSDDNEDYYDEQPDYQPTETDP